MRRLGIAALVVVGAGLTCGQAWAAEDEAVATADANNVAEVVVFGRGEAKIGVAHAASEGTDFTTYIDATRTSPTTTRATSPPSTPRPPTGG